MHSPKDRYVQDAGRALGRFTSAMFERHGSPDAAIRKITHDHGDPFSLSLPQLESLAGLRFEAAMDASAKAERHFSSALGFEEAIYPVLSDGFTTHSISQRARLASEVLRSMPSISVEAGKYNDAYDAWTALAELKQALLDIPDRRLGRLFARVAVKTRHSEGGLPPASAPGSYLMSHFAPFPVYLHVLPLDLGHDYRRVELGDRWLRATVRAAVAVVSAVAAGGLAYAYSQL